MSDKYDFNEFGSKGKRVGQAVADILAKDQPIYTAGEIIDAYGPKFAKDFEECMNDASKRYDSPFYIFVLTNKEMWAENVVRNWFIPRQTPPFALDMLTQYPNYNKSLYIVDTRKGAVKICWSIPGFEDCKTVLSNPNLYSPELVQWIKDCMEAKLEKEQYSFDEK
jgi:hypothetical protein